MSSLTRWFRLSSDPEVDPTTKVLRNLLPSAALVYVSARPNAGLTFLNPQSTKFKERTNGLPQLVQEALSDSGVETPAFIYTAASTPQAYGSLVAINALPLEDIQNPGQFTPPIPSKEEGSEQPLAIVLSTYVFQKDHAASHLISSDFPQIFSRIASSNGQIFDYSHKNSPTPWSPHVLACIGHEAFQQNVRQLTREGLYSKDVSTQLKQQIIRMGLEPLLQAVAASTPSQSPLHHLKPYEKIAVEVR
ncbi:MAG: hypothetical protein AABX70_00895 [Nanoarchaeota archaeon]